MNRLMLVVSMALLVWAVTGCQRERPSARPITQDPSKVAPPTYLTVHPDPLILEDQQRLSRLLSSEETTASPAAPTSAPAAPATAPAAPHATPATPAIPATPAKPHATPAIPATPAAPHATPAKPAAATPPTAKPAGK